MILIQLSLVKKLKHRIESLKHLFETENLDGYLVAKEVNLVYFTNYLSEEAKLLVPLDGESVLYVDGRFYEEAKEKVTGCKVELAKKKAILDQMVQSQMKDPKLKHIGFDSLDVAVYLNFSKALGNAELMPKNEIVMQLRKVKDKQEIESIRKAAELTSEGMKAAIETVKPGLREYEVAAEAEHKMRKSGSGMLAFDTIVAGGFRSAFPHARCSDYKIKKGDLVVIDLGASFRHYKADITRTVVAGKPSAKQVKIYKIVKDAQEKAFQSVKAEVKCVDVDAVARKHIEKEGYAEHFVHGLGHGVGLEVHEMPTLNSESKDVLTSGNVVTVEPGIYIAGFGGVRVEDTMLVGENRGEKLTKASYMLEVE
jgi:Xaa-Pro aminopeptidase